MANGVMVQFYTEVVEDEEASRAEGRFIGQEIEMVRKTMGLNSATEDRAFDHDRKRFAAEYEAFKKGEEVPINGTPLAECSLFSKSQAEELKREGIYTLEDLMAVPDGRLPGPGMKVLRDKARAFMEAAKDTGAVAAEVVELRKENDALKVNMAEMQEQISELVEKKKRGRPPKAA